MRVILRVTEAGDPPSSPSASHPPPPSPTTKSTSPTATFSASASSSCHLSLLLQPSDLPPLAATCSASVLPPPAVRSASPSRPQPPPSPLPPPAVRSASPSRLLSLRPPPSSSPSLLHPSDPSPLAATSSASALSPPLPLPPPLHSLPPLALFFGPTSNLGPSVLHPHLQLFLPFLHLLCHLSPPPSPPPPPVELAGPTVL